MEKQNCSINTKKTLVVNKYQLKKDYPIIGKGDEGTVYNYQNKYAIKTFDFLRESYNHEGLEKN